jgi:DedD protein
LSSHFQNRLVGVIVLVALGVIFLPDLLDGKKDHQAEQFAEIPLRPEVELVELPDPDFEAVDLSESEQAFEPATDELDELVQAIEEKENQDKQTATQQQNKPVEQSQIAKVKPTTSSVSAYTLQLGSFKSADNVNGLVKQLREKGFTAYTLPQKPVDGRLTKVFVGPNVSKIKLQKLRQDIEKLTKLTGRIVTYSPTL